MLLTLVTHEEKKKKKEKKKEKKKKGKGREKKSGVQDAAGRGVVGHPGNFTAQPESSTVKSFRQLMVTILNRPAHPLCSPVGVLQMGACSCLKDHLQKVPE
ncbi:hypothetical protein PAMP_000191 [Pampus punctatissimus]